MSLPARQLDDLLETLETNLRVKNFASYEETLGSVVALSMKCGVPTDLSQLQLKWPMSPHEEWQKRQDAIAYIKTLRGICLGMSNGTQDLSPVISRVLAYLNWCLGHDRTPDSYPARFLFRANLEEMIRRAGGGGMVDAVLSWLFANGYVRQPVGKWEAVDSGPGGVVDGPRRSHDAQELVGYVEITSKVLEPQETVAEQPGRQEEGNAETNERRVNTSMMPMLLSAADLANRLGMPDRARDVDRVLRRIHDRKPDCRVPVPNPRRGEPRYLYRTADVWQELLDWLEAP